MAHGIESLATNSTVDNAFVFSPAGGFAPCSHKGAVPVPTGGSPAMLLAARRDFNLTCESTNNDGGGVSSLVGFHYPLARITCPANCSTVTSRVYGRHVLPGAADHAEGCWLARAHRQAWQARVAPTLPDSTRWGSTGDNPI